ncbi:hypothetical protein Hamer_G027524, partial [Homarus americanus]
MGMHEVLAIDLCASLTTTRLTSMLVRWTQ